MRGAEEKRRIAGNRNGEAKRSMVRDGTDVHGEDKKRKSIEVREIGKMKGEKGTWKKSK